MVKQIIHEQKTEYAIVISANATVVEQTAAKELQQYLKKATGAWLSIICEGDAERKAFYVGHTLYAKQADVAGKS